MDRTKRHAGSDRLDLPRPAGVLPERDHVAAAAMRAGIEQVGRRHDRRGRACRVRRDRELPDHVLLGRAFRIRPAAGDARDDRQGAQVDEHVPRVAKHDRVVGAQPVLGRDLDGSGDGARAHPNP